MLVVQKKLDNEQESIEMTITKYCYDGESYEAPHVPEKFHKNISNLEEKKAEKGQMYKKLNAMYEMALPISLAFYASDKRSKEWNREFFNTKVEQRCFFECICGGTEEGRGRGDIVENIIMILIDYQTITKAK